MTNYYSDQMATSRMHGWHVYVLSMPIFSKIGSAARVEIRLAGIQNGNPYQLKIEAIWHFKCRSEARAVEALALTLVPGRLPKRDWCQAPPTAAIAAVEFAIEKCGFAVSRKQAAA